MLFSVVIPTWNCSKIVRHAIRSVLEQECRDFELIVSDNQSDDDTQAVVEELMRQKSEEQIRYIKPERYLNLISHWEWASRHAVGDYVLVLSADDCLTPRALRRIQQAIKEFEADIIINAYNATYTHPDYGESSKANRLTINRCSSGQISRMDSHEELRRRFSFTGYTGEASHVVISSNVAKRVRERTGCLFAPSFPEFYAFTLALSFTSSFVYIDWPLALHGSSARSMTPLNRQRDGEKRWREIHEEPFRFVPLRGWLVANGIAESYLHAKASIPENFVGIELDVANYLRAYHRDLLDKKRAGHDISKLLSEFWDYVSTVPDQIQRKLLNRKKRESFARKGGSGPREYLKRFKEGLLGSPEISRLAHHIHPSLSSRRIVLPGKDHGFENILDCANRLDEIVNRYSYPQSDRL